MGASHAIVSRGTRPTDAIASGEPACADDAALVERFRSGEREAFELLVRRYQKPIYHFVLRHIGDADDAAELTQRAFIKAFQGFGGFRGGAEFRSWLYRIAVNLALNHLRDRARFTDEAAAAERPGEGALVVERLMDAERAHLLRRAVAELPPKQRLTLELRVYEDLSFREIGQVLGSSEGAAKVNYHYAVKRLKERLGDATAERHE
jgi:RNA polymerase sigma-70 factor (ECF subfamily)